MLPTEFIKSYSVARRGTSCLKWDGLAERFGDADLLAMWVADMDFRAPKAVTDALHVKVAEQVYGYPLVPDSFLEAYGDWLETNHKYRPEPDWVRYAPSVVTALYWLINSLTRPGDAVLIQTPVYYPFGQAVQETGRNLYTADLTYEQGRFSIDFDAFEHKIESNRVRLLLLCSPHNPVGRVWTREELDQIMAICARHDVIVVSDEVHQDFTFDNAEHICALRVANGRYADRTVVVNATSKTFNLAGVGMATILIPDAGLQARYDAANKHQFSPGMFEITASEAAYRGGAEWLEALLKVVAMNYDRVKATLPAALPGAHVCRLEGTYLPLVDLTATFRREEVKPFIQDRCKIAVDYGEWFGARWGGFIRLNLATSPDNISDLIDRITSGYSTQWGIDGRTAD